MRKNNRVFGVIGVKATMANWNADFSGNPKSISSSQYFGSDKALKYPMKAMWETQGEKILYIRSYKVADKTDKMQPRKLSERYVQIFGKSIDDKTSSKEVLKNLFNAIDVMSFGATFAEKKQNISITGCVQIGQGFNKYEDTNVIAQDILSPFRNSNENSDDNAATSLGTKIITDEAHYFYPFSINPDNYRIYEEMGIDGFEGYTTAAYEKFKTAALVSATAFNTNSKSGCENEFALFINCKENSKLYLPPLDSYVTFSKQQGENIIDISKIDTLLQKHKDEIISVEVYYNDINTTIKKGNLNCDIKSIY